VLTRFDDGVFLLAVEPLKWIVDAIAFLLDSLDFMPDTPYKGPVYGQPI
jgi:hypothetical protein